MNFKESRAIYLQIADRICDDILLGQYEEEGRIPSVREYASIVEVNANTVMRSYEYLQSQEVIYNKRGIGFFVASGAKALIHSLRKEQFLKEEVDGFFRQLYTLGISIKEVEKMYYELYKNKTIKNRYDMKRTTYIIIGLFVLGLLFIPVLLRTPAGEKAARRLSMEGERTEIEMAGIRHVKIVEKLGKIDKDDIGIAGQLDVQASPALGKSIFAYPKSEYLNVIQEGDCLLIEVDMDNEDLSQIVRSLDKGHRLILDGLNLELKADSTLLSIENRAARVDINIRKLCLDSLFLFNEEWQDISLDSCRFRSLDIRGKRLSLKADQVKVTDYYEELGTIRSSETFGFNVDNLYLSGKDSHRYRTGINCKRIFWNPLAKDAELELTLRQKGEIILNR